MFATQALDFSPMGARFPALVSYGFLLLGASLLAMNVSRAGPQGDLRPFASVPWRIWATVVAALALFGYVVDIVGFYESALLFVVFTSWLLAPPEVSQARRLLGAVLFAVPFTAAVYLAFRIVLEIPTPRGLIL